MCELTGGSRVNTLHTVFIMRPGLGGFLRLPDVANLVLSAAGHAAEADGEPVGARGVARGAGGLLIPPPGAPPPAAPFPRLAVGGRAGAGETWPRAPIGRGAGQGGRRGGTGRRARSLSILPARPPSPRAPPRPAVITPITK